MNKKMVTYVGVAIGIVAFLACKVRMEESQVRAQIFDSMICATKIKIHPEWRSNVAVACDGGDDAESIEETLLTFDSTGVAIGPNLGNDQLDLRFLAGISTRLKNRHGLRIASHHCETSVSGTFCTMIFESR